MVVQNRTLIAAGSTIALAFVLLFTSVTGAHALRTFTLDGAHVTTSESSGATPDTPGTPFKYNRVKVLKQGPRKAKKILVLVPGTSAGATNFRPMASALLKRLKGWQVWSIERRENMLEDHSVLEAYRNGEASAQEMLDYYLNSLIDPSISPRFTPKTTEETAFARNWGLKVAVKDVRRVIRKAGRNGRKVVLGGHSLGGSITTAYATWKFRSGRAGAKDLDGLVFIDGAGGARGGLPTAAEARERLDGFSQSSPFLSLLPLPLPWAAGVFNAMGSTAALTEPDDRSVLQDFPLLPGDLKPPVSTTNLAQYGYAVDQATSPESLALVHSNIGHLADSGDPRGWVNGELGSVRRAASVFAEIDGMDGSSWYHPVRLSIDAGVINNGISNPAQKVYGVRAVYGDRVRLPMYGFDAALGGGRVGDAVRALAEQSGVPDKWIRTVDRSGSFAHIDPLSAAPEKNDFIKTLAPFLKKKIK